jgi:glycosyltransferase involved in cell wall biosynthesis
VRRQQAAPKRIAILGTRGIPARHGGFETLAERLALFLRDRGWSVAVYCQAESRHAVSADSWKGVQRVTIAPVLPGSLGTGIFDLRACIHAAGRWPLQLVLGYNTAVFCGLARLRNGVVIMNMDGIEWRRKKWRWPQRWWLRVNERLGCAWASHLIADNPRIHDHLLARARAERISTIPYGADAIEQADVRVLDRWGLTPFGYVSLVARPEPENSVLEIVRAFSRRRRGVGLMVLGQYDPRHPYHRRVTAAANRDVVFAGGIYDRSTLAAIRYFSALYVHGHQVGGTNPSLVEALGAGNPILAHDNPFNRWVAGPEAVYFADETDCALQLDALLDDEQRLTKMRTASRNRHMEAFTWERVLGDYESLLHGWAGVAAGNRERRTPVDVTD